LVTGLLLYIKFTKESNRHFGVTFFNVGQGDAALIRFADGQKMLVDCGPNRAILSALGRHLPFYDRAIDYLLVTHPDLDHYGGCVDVLKRFQVKNIITNGETKSYDPYWETWNHTALAENAVNITMDYPRADNWGNLKFQFLAPNPEFIFSDKERTSNNSSIVFKLVKDSQSFLFTGDAEEPLEKNLIQKYCSTSTTVCPALQANVLKVGHHGSNTASSEEFLAKIKPTTAVISVGRNNKFGHPALRVLRHLERAGARVLRTDQDGDILISEK